MRLRPKEVEHSRVWLRFSWKLCLQIGLRRIFDWRWFVDFLDRTFARIVKTAAFRIFNFRRRNSYTCSRILIIGSAFSFPGGRVRIVF
jgi:hypothetical protein